MTLPGSPPSVPPSPRAGQGWGGGGTLYEDPAEAVEAQERAGLQPHPGGSPRAGWAPGTQIRSLPPLRSPGASFPPQEPPAPPPPPQCLPRCIQWGAEEEEEEDQGRGGGLGREEEDEEGGAALSAGSGAAGQVQVPLTERCQVPPPAPSAPAGVSVRPSARLGYLVPSRPVPSGPVRRGAVRSRWRTGAARAPPLPAASRLETQGHPRPARLPGPAPPLSAGTAPPGPHPGPPPAAGPPPRVGV